MHTVSFELRVWEGGNDEHVRNVGLMVDAVEDHHDGIVPSDEPEGHTALHRGQ